MLQMNAEYTKEYKIQQFNVAFCKMMYFWQKKTVYLQYRKRHAVINHRDSGHV
jgi:hypothetical protein